MKTPGIIFDLDGTLVDSVYQHVFTWNEAIRSSELSVPQWRIHRAAIVRPLYFTFRVDEADLPGLRHFIQDAYLETCALDRWADEGGAC